MDYPTIELEALQKINATTRKHRKWDVFENLEKVHIPNPWEQHHQSHANSGGFKVGFITNHVNKTCRERKINCDIIVTCRGWFVSNIGYIKKFGSLGSWWRISWTSHFLQKNHVNCIPPTPPQQRLTFPTQTKKNRCRFGAETFSPLNFGVNNLVYIYIWGHKPPYKWPYTWVIKRL